MRLNDKNTLSIAAAVSDVLEGKVKKEEAKYPHDMFHPKTGEKVVAKTKEDHEELSKKGYTHEKPEVDEAGEPRAKGEKDFKAAHKVKKSGEKEDGSVVKEKADDDTVAMIRSNPKMKDKILKSLNPKARKAVLKALGEETIEEAKFPKALVKKATDVALKMSGNMTGATKKIEKMKKGLSDAPEVKAALQMANEEVSEEIVAEAHAMNEAKSKMQEDKEKYQKFFKAALKKFGVTSPGELEGDKKKEFFDYVDKNYEAENESVGEAFKSKGGIATNPNKISKQAKAQVAVKLSKDADGDLVNVYWDGQNVSWSVTGQYQNNPDMPVVDAQDLGDYLDLPSNFKVKGKSDLMKVAKAVEKELM